MDISRQEYPALLSSLEPSQAVNVLNDRVELITRTNNDIADWLLERRKVEETYAQGLRRLARRPQRDGGASMGIFQLPWQRIIESTESLAQSHESLAQKIEVDAETPLRQFANKNREMQGISTTQGNLASIAKEYDNAQKKADKLKDKTGRFSSSRATNASSTVDDATQQWESQGTYVFEQLQSLDETRVNHLRDVLTQFQTHEIDSIEQNRKPAELCLNALLNIETADEIKSFAAQIRTEPRRAPMSRRQSSASSNIRRLSSAGGGIIPPMPPPPRLTSDITRQTVSFSNQTGQPGAGLESKEPPKKQGLKSRLGTVMGRRKHAAAPPPIPSAEKPKKDKNRSSLMPFRRGYSSRSQQDTESTLNAGRDLTTATSREEAGPTEPPMRRLETDQHFPVPTITADRQNTSQGTAMVNGTTNHVDATRSNNPYEQTPSSNNVPTPPDQPPHELSVTPPSPVQHMDAISRAQQEAAASNAENEEAVRRLKIRDQPIQEDEAEAQQAINLMSNQLRLQGQTSGINRLGGSMRGRRDVRNTIFVPNPEPPLADDEPDVSHTALLAPIGAGGVGNTSVGMTAAPYADSLTASPIKAPGITPEERTISDTTSVHSAQSLGTLVHHPEMHEPGLNSSIVETVSTWFSAGTISKSLVIGEIALAYNSTQSTTDSEMIRLDNFQVLEKIAPNPSFVSAASSEKGKEKAMSDEGAGQYSVALSAIKRTTPIVAFKYQVHLDPTNLSLYSPVLITPAWQIQDAQVSVIVLYTLNPAFVIPTTQVSSTTTSITLKNVVVSITLDPSAEAGKATSAMMAPQNGAAFKRKQGVVVWKLPELVVSNEKQKLLARFVTTGPQARPGHVEAKWELAGTTASPLGVSVLGGAGKSKEATDPFADDGTGLTSPGRVWREVNTARSLISGGYRAS